MPLSDKLSAASQTYRQSISTCKLIALTLDISISKKDRDALAKVIDLTNSDEGYLPNSTLASLLKEEGYDVSTSAVDRHRAQKCSCKRPGSK
jgi:hypothetical protein